jgi:DNA-binding XRE family transcriptional regulator
MQTVVWKTFVGECERSAVPSREPNTGTEAVARRMGENVKRERVRANLSQEKLAQRAGLHRTEIGLLEQGRRTAGATTILQLAGALSISPGDFFDGIYWTPDIRGGGAFTLGSRSRPDPE